MAPPSATQGRAAGHSCALYTEEGERDQLLHAFLREGLLEGDKCLYIVDLAEPTAVRRRMMRALRLDEDPEQRPQLDIERAPEVHLRAGRFNANQTASFLTDSMGRALDANFDTLRGAGGMNWLPRARSAEDCVSYEQTIHRAVTRMPALFMCLYDLQQCTLEVLMHVLQSHSTVRLKDVVLVNPHYRDVRDSWAAAEAGEGQQQGRTRAADLPIPVSEADRWSWLTDSEIRVSAHVAAGKTNRQIAELLRVSRHTVDAHLKHIYVKLDIHTRVELTVLALRHSSRR